MSTPSTPPGTALLHLDGIEAAVAADIEHACARQVFRNCRLNVLPFHIRKIAGEVLGRRPHAAQVNVVEPIAQLSYALRKLCAGL